MVYGAGVRTLGMSVPRGSGRFGLIYVLSASVLCAALAWLRLDGRFVGRPIALSGFDGIGVLAGFAVFVMAAWAAGPAIATAILISLLLHEMGHVIAHQMMGHASTRFRLAPMIADEPISDLPLQTDGQTLFAALMGPGFCLLPMVLAHLAALGLAEGHPTLANGLRTFAITCGAVNFVLLLPFWPLDGGRCVRIASRSIWPALAPALAVFMTAALAMAAMRGGSVPLLLLAVIGVQSLLRRDKGSVNPLLPDNALLALAAYAFTLAAHFSGGWALLSQYL